MPLPYLLDRYSFLSFQVLQSGVNSSRRFEFHLPH
jgi:hypothetical protein